jgi:hypothetical protein
MGRAMRELHGRHARDGHDSGVDAPAAHDRDAVRHPRYEPVPDAATRTARALEYRQRVDAKYAADRARLAGPRDGGAGQAPDGRTDRPASRIADRNFPEHEQQARKRKPERSWLPSNEASQVARRTNEPA